MAIIRVMTSMMRKAFGPVLALLAMLAVPSAASATSIQFIFDQGLSGGPFGSVILTQTVANQVVVTVLLDAGNGFVDTGNANGNHPDFAFTLDPTLGVGAGDITILEDGLDPLGDPSGPWNWVFGGPVTTSDSLGTFGYHFRCSDPNPPAGTQRCGSGASNPNPGPLQFRITKAGLLLTSFLPSTGAGLGEHHYFVADIIAGEPGGGGATGLVWADSSVTIDDQCFTNCGTVATPEPASMMLLGTGLVGLTSAVRRRRRTS
jgi:hypothetical protein